MNNTRLTILHTADWHLGHRLHGVCRDYEHAAFLSWLLIKIEKTQADALIIAGDIFDSANPSASAQSDFYDFLVKARECRQALDIIIIGGNHDSASRLDAPSQILQSLGIRMIGGLTYLDNGDVDWQRLLIPISDDHGTVRAICGAMPFIRNADLPQLKKQADDISDPLIEGVKTLYQKLFEALQKYKSEQQLTDSVGQILTGHCYMVGTELSELSERRILGGNQHALPANIFNENIHYVALGHLHKAQFVKNNSTSNASSQTLIRYSGSPIPLSFTERNYKHQISQISLGGDPITVEVEPIVIPRSVAIKCVPEHGYVKISELEGLINTLQFEKKNVEIETECVITELSYPLLEVKVELSKPEPGLRQQIELMLDCYAVRLLKISIQYPGKGEALADKNQQTRLEELRPEEVFQKCYQRSFEQRAPDSMTQLFQQLLESVEENE